MVKDIAETTEVSLRDAVRMDRLMAPIAFTHLAQTVESMMLSNPLDRTPIQPYSGERALTAQFGAHALRVLLETQNGVEYNMGPDGDMAPFDMVRSPDTFVDQEVPGVAEWALDFGDALLREAYKSLGADAEQKLIEYRNATTADEQMAVITWLDERMYAMREPARAAGGEDDYLFYHPLRLSPKVIGSYPNTMMPPTCLGFSILATSFLYSAGAPTLHAGVIRTDFQEDMIESSILSVRTANDITAMFNGNEPDIAWALRERGYGSYQDMIDSDSGYHAVALTRLIDGRWAQVDPNFRSTQVVDDTRYNERMTTVYDQLEEFAPVAPLLELTTATSMNSLVKEWTDAYTSDIEISADHIEQLTAIFTDDDIESMPRRIYEVIYAMREWMHTNDDPENVVTGIRRTMDGDLFFGDENGDVDHLGETTPLGSQIYALISKFVLYEQDVADIKAHCRRDERFLQRRISDVAAIVASLQTLETGVLVDSSRTDVPHMAYEVGRPAPRVAMTVLSDFAALMANDPLPPTFWHSTWPSLVPITEAAEAARTPAQQQASQQMARFALSKTLQYIKNYDTIINASESPTD